MNRVKSAYMETTPIISDTLKSWKATMDASGRVLLPAELRKKIGATPGSDLTWVHSEDGLKLQTLDAILKDVREHFCSLGSPEEIWSEELIAERKIEAAREEAQWKVEEGE